MTPFGRGVSEAEHLLGMNDPAQVQRTVPKATDREKRWGAAEGGLVRGKNLASKLFVS